MNIRDTESYQAEIKSSLLNFDMGRDTGFTLSKKDKAVLLRSIQRIGELSTKTRNSTQPATQN